MARSGDLARRLDRVIGILCAAIVARVLNRRKQLPNRADRIGIIQPTAIGDTVIGLNVVMAIRERYPNAELRCYHGATNATAVAMLPLDLMAIQTDFSRPWRALACMLGDHLDLVVDMTPWPNITAMCARIAGPVCVGFAPAHSRRARLFDSAVPHRTDRHEADNLAEMAAVFMSSPPVTPPLKLSDYILPPEIAVGRLVLCHMSAGGTRAADKAWPKEYWLALVRRLGEEGYQVGFTGAQSDNELVDDLITSLEGRREIFSLCGKLSLPALGRLLGDVPLLVTIDTGVLHIASAVGARSVGLHGPTRSWRWGSRSERAVGLDSPHPAAGYINYGYELAPEGARVMVALTPDKVIDAVLAALAPSVPNRGGAPLTQVVAGVD